jgi:hypothetical protein
MSGIHRSQLASSARDILPHSRLHEGDPPNPAIAGLLLRLGLSSNAKVLDLKERVRCRGCGAKGRGVVSVKWGRQGG